MTGAPKRLALRVAAAALCATAAVLAQSPVDRSRESTPAQAPQPPTFRAGVNFVQVDVYPTVNRAPVADLSQGEFEVLEDGVPQVISTFEHVSASPRSTGVPLRDPRSTSDERQMVADPRNRLFVVFLDSYHTTDWAAWHNGTQRRPGSVTTPRPRDGKSLGPRDIDKAIVRFLERFIGPNDLVAAMSPEMDAGAMTFGRRPERFEEWVNTAWARRFSWDEMDPEEERWARCYPPDDQFHCYVGIWDEMVLRRREYLALRALEDTVDHLGTLREGRKAVLVVSEGWPMYRPDRTLARSLPRVPRPTCPPDPPALPRTFVGSDGTLQRGDDSRNPQSPDWSVCESSRMKMALLDNLTRYQRLLDRANRETVTFYPVDPRGLAVFDTPIDARSPAGSARSDPTDEFTRVRERLETLRNLASATDGIFSESNDLDASMKRIADDLSDYYLLGYTTTNTALDGKFRKITVRVKRPGVVVRARRGYLAPTREEVAAGGPAAPAEPAARARESAVAALETAAGERIVRVAAGFEWHAPAGGGPAAPGLWMLAELADFAARQPEWRGGGEALVTVSDSRQAVVATTHGRVSGASRALAWSPAGVNLQPGEYVVRVVLRSDSGGAPAVDQQRVVLSPGPDQAGTPRLYRRGPSTGVAYQQTAEPRFRRVERVRFVFPSSRAATTVAARLLDRKGQELGVPVSVQATDTDGQPSVVAEATLASLAPGDYLLEVALGEGPARQIVVTAFRVIP